VLLKNTEASFLKASNTCISPLLKPAATINDKAVGDKLSSDLTLALPSFDESIVGEELVCKAIVFAIEAFEFISKHVDMNVLYIRLSMRFRLSFES
jgi:hypothetical protein